MRRLAATALVLVAGCSPVVPPLPSSTSTLGYPTSSAVAAGPSTAAIGPCRAAQVVMTPGHSGVGLGTAYLRVFVELAQKPPCSLPRSPMIWITAKDGAEVARSNETD